MTKPQTQSFDARSKRLGELLTQPSRGFFIPEYQRRYSWGEDDIDRLFEDLSHATELVIREEDRLTFFGSFILVDADPVPREDVPTAVSHVVDGQQRIATIIMLAIGMSRRIAKIQNTIPKEYESFNVAQQLANLLRDVSVIDTRRDPVNKWPRLIRAGDRWAHTPGLQTYDSPIATLISEVAIEGANSPSIDADSPLGQAYNRIIDGISELADGNTGTDLDHVGSLWSLSDGAQDFAEIQDAPEDENDKKLRRLILAGRCLLERIEVISVNAPDEDYAFSLFEPLNTTGQLLTALETLKPRIVKLENDDGMYSGSHSAQAFDEIQDIAEESNPDKKTKRTADLITVFALAEAGEKLSHRLSAQRSFLRSLMRGATVEEARAMLDNLRDVAVFQRDMWEPSQPTAHTSFPDDVWVALRFLSESRHKITRALLARYYAAFQEGKPVDFNRLVKAVAAFWFFWRSSRSGTGGIDSHYRNIMAKGWPSDSSSKDVEPIARLKGKVRNVDDVVAAFRSILDSKGGISGKSDWLNSTTNINVYGGKAVQEFGLLAAHHDAIPDENEPGFLADGNKGTRPTLTREYWKTAYTTEHIAPQNRRGSDKSYDEAIYSNSLMNRWGNLTLVPQAENSLLSNRPWEHKREVYKILGEADAKKRKELLEDTGLTLQEETKKTLDGSLHLTFCQAVALHDEDQWTEKVVEARTEGLAGRMWDKLWPWLQ